MKKLTPILEIKFKESSDVKKLDLLIKKIISSFQLEALEMIEDIHVMVPSYVVDANELNKEETDNLFKEKFLSMNKCACGKVAIITESGKLWCLSCDKEIDIQWDGADDD